MIRPTFVRWFPFSLLSFPRFEVRGGIRPFARSPLGALLDPIELMAPEIFEGPDPIVYRFQFFRFEPVHALSASPHHGDQADLAQYAQVLRDRRLWKSQRHDERSHARGAAPGQKLDHS